MLSKKNSMVTMVTDEFLENRIILQKSVATIGFIWFFWFQKCILLYIFAQVFLVMRSIRSHISLFRLGFTPTLKAIFIFNLHDWNYAMPLLFQQSVSKITVKNIFKNIIIYSTSNNMCSDCSHTVNLLWGLWCVNSVIFRSPPLIYLSVIASEMGNKNNDWKDSVFEKNTMKNLLLMKTVHLFFFFLQSSLKKPLPSFLFQTISEWATPCEICGILSKAFHMGSVIVKWIGMLSCSIEKLTPTPCNILLQPITKIVYIKVFWSSGRPLLCFSRFWLFENVARIRCVYVAYSRTKKCAHAKPCVKRKE